MILITSEWHHMYKLKLYSILYPQDMIVGFLQWNSSLKDEINWEYPITTLQDLKAALTSESTFPGVYHDGGHIHLYDFYHHFIDAFNGRKPLSWHKLSSAIMELHYAPIENTSKAIKTNTATCMMSMSTCPWF